MSKWLLGIALICAPLCAQAQGKDSEAEAIHRAQFRTYIDSLETPANEILQDTLKTLTREERAKVPVGLRVRVGWAGPLGAANGTSGCTELGQPAFLDYETTTIWLCEEGVQAVSNLIETIWLTSWGTGLEVINAHPDLLKQLKSASDTPMPDSFNLANKQRARAAAGYLLSQYVDQVNSRLLNQFHPRVCFGYVVAYLASQNQNESRPIVCSRENLNPSIEQKASTWYGNVVIGTSKQLAQGFELAKSLPSNLSREQIAGFHAGFLRLTIGYFVLHELGHIVSETGRVTGNTPKSKKISAEVLADRFVYEDRFGFSGQKMFVSLGLDIFWRQLADYGAGPSLNTEMIEARGHSIESILCEKNRAQPEYSDPQFNAFQETFRQESCRGVKSASD